MPDLNLRYTIIGTICFVALAYIIGLFGRLKEVSTPIDPTPKELACYLENYPDLQEQFGTDITKAREHWYAKGALEGRVPHCPRTDGLTPKPLTDEQALQYLHTYLDLQRMYGKNDLEAAKKHWLEIGYLEGRVVPQAWTSDLPSSIFMISGQTNKRCGAQPGTGKLVCGDKMDTFNLRHLGDDRLALQTGTKYCGDKTQQVLCTQNEVGPGESFVYQKVGQNKFTLRSGVSNLYCADNNMGSVVCDRQNPDHFQFYRLPPPPGAVAGEINTNTRSKPFPPTLVTPPPPRKPMQIVKPLPPPPPLPSVSEQVVNQIWFPKPATPVVVNTTNAIQPNSPASVVPTMRTPATLRSRMRFLFGF
jgi:hypothetical protein